MIIFNSDPVCKEALKSKSHLSSNDSYDLGSIIYNLLFCMRYLRIQVCNEVVLTPL